MDDTDNLESRGTGRLARAVAGALGRRFAVRGVTRHQLLVDPRVPYTSHNSSAALHLDAPALSAAELVALADEVGAQMLADFQTGSDPGLCVAQDAPPALGEFGRRAKRDVVTQAEARALAAQTGCILRGLGGTQDGVIGALAAVGLAAGGEDGRFLLVGRSRELTGLLDVPAILACGIAEVRRLDTGARLEAGVIDANAKLRPALRGGRAVLYVAHPEGDETRWVSVKLD